MNTHDIELRSAVMGVITDVWDRAKQIDDAADEVLDLINADRKRRGEPVALELRDRMESALAQRPAAVPVRVTWGEFWIEQGDWEMANDYAAFEKAERWLLAQQTAEPVKKKDWNAELSSWSDEDFVQVFHECPDLADRLRRVLAEPVKKKPYAQGSALGEFGIIPMCDQVDE